MENNSTFIEMLQQSSNGTKITEPCDGNTGSGNAVIVVTFTFLIVILCGLFWFFVLNCLLRIEDNSAAAGSLDDVGMGDESSDLTISHSLSEVTERKMYVANLLKTEMFVCDTDGEEKADASPPHCAICLETFKYGDEISSSHHCEHFHHHGCIFPWLLEHDDCPVCRRSLTAAS